MLSHIEINFINLTYSLLFLFFYYDFVVPVGIKLEFQIFNIDVLQIPSIFFIKNDIPATQGYFISCVAHDIDQIGNMRE